MTRPLVLVHGFTGWNTSWDRVKAGLRTHSRCISPLGHSGPNELEDRVRCWDDELGRIVSLMPPEPVHLAGYSLGARLALGIALAFPARVARLTLISGHTGLPTEAERTERRASDARWCALLETEGIAGFVESWEAQPLFATQARLSASLRAEQRAIRLSHDPHGLVRALRVIGLAEMPDYATRLASLAAPLTVLVGELDAKFLALGRAASERSPNGRLVVVPNAGHDLLLERPDLVALVLSEPTA